MTKTFTFNREAFHANEDGTTRHAAVSVLFDPERETFSIFGAPAYLDVVISQADYELPSFMHAETVSKCVDHYGTVCEKYSAWRLAQRAEPNMLWIGRQHKRRTEGMARDIFGLDAQVGIGMRRVGKFTDKESGEIVVFDESGKLALDLMNEARREHLLPIIVPDTPEIRAKVEALVRSVQLAADLLQGMADAADPVAYLTALELLSSLRLCANVPAQWAVQTALGGYQSIRELITPGGRLYESRRAIVEMVNASRYLKLATPGGAMYAFPSVDRERLPQFDDQQFALELLEQKHVLVAPGVSFNVPYRNHFRVTTLPDAATLRMVFSRIEE